LKALHKTGQPVLIATSSVATSRRISTLLKKVGLSHEVLNALQDAEEAATVAKAGQAGAITVASNMAGRGTDIKLGNSVAELGGLHVISIDRNESRRVDRQLFGRCGRQGDPGSTEVFLSLQSELLTHFYSPALLQVLQKTVLLRCLNRWQPAARLLSYLPQSALQKKHKRQRSNTLAQDQQLKDYLAFAGRE
jgi:preprotein translocase subunit SecA